MKNKFLLSAMFLIFFIGLYIPASYSQNPCPGIPTIDYAGKTYNTVAIGDQCWLKENLDVGTMILGSQYPSNNGIIEKYCYNNDLANCSTYGGFYPWDEAMQYINTAAAQGICPAGWHIPTYSELQTLATTLSNNSNALKAVGQGTDGGAGTNTSGFSALLAGYCNYLSPYFANLGYLTYFWSSTEDGAFAYIMSLYYSDSNFDFYEAGTALRYSVRCLNDNYPSPVELGLFIAVPNGRTVQLNWETKTEKNSDKFNVERKTIGNDWGLIGSVKAAVLSNSPKQYSYIDKNLQSGKYQYRLKMIDNDGTFEYSKVIETEVTTPKNFELSQNFPNPWNPSTKINYNLPFDSKVTLEVYNITGERISQLVNEEQSAGYYSVDFGSSKLSSGVYFYRITALDKVIGNNFSAIKKMILIK